MAKDIKQEMARALTDG